MTGGAASPGVVFAVGRGQYENIGDIILRRPLLDWAREAGQLHVYVGGSPDGYDDGLGLREGDVVYRSFVRWYAALARAAVRGRASSVYKPGEIQLTLVGMKEHVAMVPATLLVRLRRGGVARVGVGSRNFRAVPRAIMWPSNALSTYTRWRDDVTADYLGFGPAAPDLGFAEGMPDAQLAAELAAPGERDLLVVSLRADTEVAPRPYPDAEWIAAVRSFARRRGLRIVVATQVHVDDERTRRLAADLGATTLPWSGPDGHARQEARLRETYRRTAVAVSDRLHVLIAAATEGAVPIGVQLDDSDKIDRHFRTIGVEGVSFNTRGRSAEDVVAGLEARADRREDVIAAILDARARLGRVREEVVAELTRTGGVPRATPEDGGGAAEVPVVYHVGRGGDVAGGMAQVVNAYLAWPFAHSRVALIPSRGRPHDHLRAARLFVSALRRVRAIAKAGRPAVIVVHLSERGSFVREGLIAQYARRLGLPVVAHLHGSEFAAFEAAHPRLVERVLRSASVVITLSDESSRIASRHVPAERVHLVPNAVPPGTPVEKKRTIVFGGVVGARKGVDVLLSAWGRLADRDGWELLIAGPVAEPSIAADPPPGARLLGAVGHAELMALLDEAAVAVLPSRDEAMPMFLIEAMARGTAVVSTTVGGIPGLVGDAGILTEPGDVDALQQALRTLIADAAERERLAQAADARFRDAFSAEVVYPRVEALWLGAITHM